MGPSGENKPGGPVPARKEQPLGLAVVSLLVLVIVAIVAIPILMRVFGEAARRGSDEDETSDQDPSRHSGPGRE